MPGHVCYLFLSNRFNVRDLLTACSWSLSTHGCFFLGAFRVANSSSSTQNYTPHRKLLPWICSLKLASKNCRLGGLTYCVYVQQGTSSHGLTLAPHLRWYGGCTMVVCAHVTDTQTGWGSTAYNSLMMTHEIW